MFKLLRPLFFAALFTLGFGLFAEIADPPEGASAIPSAPSAPAAPEVRWYRSNGAGMALEEISSSTIALQNEFALSVERLSPGSLPWALPGLLRPYYEASFRVEQRRLFENTAEVRRQWVFSDTQGINRIIAAGSGPLFGFIVQKIETKVIQTDEEEIEEEPEDPEEPEEPGEEEEEEEVEEEEEEEEDEPKSSGFIEIRNFQGQLIRELQYNEDLSEWDFRFTYRDDIMIRTETWVKEAPLPPPPPPPPVEEIFYDPDELENEDDEDKDKDEDEVEAPPPPPPPPPVVEVREPVFVRMYTDVFRYTRAGSIRAVDRTLHEGAGAFSRTSFPGLGPRIISPEDELPIHGGTYTGEYFHGGPLLEGMVISYSLDTRGRVLTETWRDEDGSLIGMLENTWVEDRLQSVSWRSDNEERRVEFEYNSEGDRIAERNLRNGVLERSVTHQDGQDTEEIYINGRLVLRAIWRDGIRVSEERIR